MIINPLLKTSIIELQA